MAFRLILVIVLTASCALAGRLMALRGKRHADELSCIREDLKSLKEYTLIRFLPMSDALLKMRTGIFAGMGAAMKNADTMTPAEAFSLAKHDEMSQKAQTSLAALFEAIGTLSKKEHETEYAKCALALSEEEKRLCRDSEEKNRLYTSLGALLGIAAGIFLV